jgi:hypothetical protein
VGAAAADDRGLLEIRNVGLVRMPRRRPGGAALRLDRERRATSRAAEARRARRVLPLIRLWPDTPALALRVEWALRMHGLP